MTPAALWRTLLDMTPETAEALSRAVRDLVPQLDAAGFHINHLRPPKARGRFSIGYVTSLESFPDILVDAVAAVTRTGVDFEHPGTFALAWATAEHLDSLGPRRPTASIEELLAARG
jgi:hypothetical protein